MSLQNLKNQKGFTIVELLIVIVVIGILAAIVIVAYNGVTQKANTASAQGNAEAVQKVAEAYNADNGAYPEAQTTPTAKAVEEVLKDYKGTTTVPSGVTVQASAPTKENGKNTVSYKVSPASGTVTGGCVGWYNFTEQAVFYNAVGGATVAADGKSCS